MTRLDKFLYAGEKAVFSLEKESPFGAEELAATDRRLIHIKGDQFYDIQYESLVSMGCYTVYEWKWAFYALVTAFLALLCLGEATYFPGQVKMLGFTASAFSAFAVLLLVIFILNIKSGIIMKTRRETLCFSYKRSQKKDAFDFVKVTRAAGVGILKVHKSIKPEIIEPEQRGLEIVKPVQMQPKNKMPKL